MGQSVVVEQKARGHARVACLLAAVLTGCVGDEIAGSGEALRGGRGGHHGGGHHGPDAGPAADAGASGDACTRTPDEWLATCDGDEPRTCGRGPWGHDPRTRGRGHACDRGPSERECEDLGSTDERTRELAALRVNVRVLGDRARRWCRGRDSEDDFEDLHFSHGYRRTLSVADLLDDPSVDLSAIADANRAFEGCVDRGVLVPWVETPVCTGSPVGPRPPRGSELRSVEGPEVAPCLGLDTRCMRGALNPALSCCSAELMPRGTVCEEDGSMLCDGAGACVEAESIPLGERVAAPADWLGVFPTGLPRSSDGTANLVPRVLGVALELGSGPAGIPVPVVEIQAPLSSEPEAVEGTDEEGGPMVPDAAAPDVLAIVPRSLVGTSRVTLARSAASAAIQAIAYEGPPVPHALVLRAPEGVSEVWAVRGALDELGRVMSDGSSAGAVRLSCQPPFGVRAAAPIEVRCEIALGALVVIGTDVSLAWIPADGEPQDVLGGIPAGAGGGLELLTAGDFLPQTGGRIPCAGRRTCALPGGCSGERVCVNGRYTACIASGAGLIEACDGVDNNCNGLTDETGDIACNDRTDCTLDRCAGAGGPGASCAYTPLARAYCLGAVRPGPPTCVTAVCMGSTGVTGVTRTVSLTNPLADAPIMPAAWGFAGTVPTGCTYFAANTWCTNSWDSCNCNGPELCNPAVSANAGCVSAPRFIPATTPPVPGVPPIDLDPCDRDGLACTRERGCCEPAGGGFCRADAMLARTEAGRAALDLRQAACDLPFAPSGSWPAFPLAASPAAFPTVSPALPVECTGGPDLGAPLSDVCPHDGDPCTVEACNEEAGGSCALPPPSAADPFPQFVDTSASGESYVDRATGEVVTGPSCIGAVPGSRGCRFATCGNGPTCGSFDTFLGDVSVECNAQTGPPNGCYLEACVAGECGPFTRNDDLCPPLPGCVEPSLCLGASATPDATEDDVPPGCRPPSGFCYIEPLEQVDGPGLDGFCLPSGPSPGNQCRVCNPAANPWGYTDLPDGTGCTSDVSGSPCFENPACVAGTCRGTCNPTLPGCAEECG